jgi:hypothetical protein
MIRSGRSWSALSVMRPASKDQVPARIKDQG